jgi:predicted TIM-barrel fold metal-dependent hydrolase
MHPLLQMWHDATVAHVPQGVAVWDAHTHTGDRDPDGYTNTAAQLLSALDEAGHVGAVVCSSLDPGGYRGANDRILAESAAAGGRLIPFLRLNPNDEGAALEAERSLDAGHRGIKLHPRGESFTLSDPGMAVVARIACERGVPLLIHAGRGMLPLAGDLLALLDRDPQLRVVLAHCAISDLDVLAVERHPSIYYDTAWWNPVDLAALFSWVDGSRILYASDTPYGNPVISSIRTLRSMLQAGHGQDVITAVFGANLSALLGGSDPDPVGVGSSPSFDVRLLRLQSYVLAALAASFAGTDPTEAAELALRACDGPWPEGSAVPSMRQLLSATVEASGEEHRRLRFGLLLVAASAASTPDVAAPPR